VSLSGFGADLSRSLCGPVRLEYVGHTDHHHVAVVERATAVTGVFLVGVMADDRLPVRCVAATRPGVVQ